MPSLQMAFVASLGTAFSPNALNPAHALACYKQTCHPAHKVWDDEISLKRCTLKFRPRLAGHQKVCRLLWLGMAIHKNASSPPWSLAVELLRENIADRGRHCVDLTGIRLCD